jgi:hypothetical protein
MEAEFGLSLTGQDLEGRWASWKSSFLCCPVCLPPIYTNSQDAPLNLPRHWFGLSRRVRTHVAPSFLYMVGIIFVCTHPCIPQFPETCGSKLWSLERGRTPKQLQQHPCPKETVWHKIESWKNMRQERVRELLLSWSWHSRESYAELST